MCVQQFRRIFDLHRYSSSKVFTARGTSKHDVESYLDPDIFAPDPAELCDSDDSCGNHPFPVNDQVFIMHSSEDEPLSNLNARLRPRRRTSSPQSKTTKKTEGKITQDKPKRTSTPSRALPNNPEDLTIKPDSFPAPQHLCPHCDRKFASKQAVSKHARRIHLSSSKQDFFIACLFCNHTEAESGDIIRHMVDNHPNQYIACLDCQTRFSSTSELAEHKLNVCEKQKPYRSKLRQKSCATKKAQKNLNIDRRDDFQSDKEYNGSHGFNGIVISCELKPSKIQDEADIEDNITTNLILPPSKSLATSTVIEKNAVIVLDDIQWNKRIPPNFSFHNTDADQILSRLGVVHRSPRTGETTRRDWFKTIDDSTQKFEKCFDTSFYSKVASNVAENLAKCLDGSFNFNPDLENTIKTRKAKNSVVINTAEGFPILLAREQYSRNMFDSYMPRSIAPKHKWKWDSPESDKSLMNADQIKRDSHTNNCIITLVSSLDIWTQLSMRKKFENKFNISHVEKKTEKQSIIDKELKDILESREIPTTSSTQITTYSNSPPLVRDGLDFPSYLGLAPSAPSYDLQPAVLSGEWVRPRCYVCCACGAQTRDSRALSTHISIQHPNAQVQHYEIVGEPLLNADILKHLYVPPTQVFNRTRPLRGIRECTKCQKSITLKELHQHMLDCAGDTPAVRRKCRYRPFGVRRKRPRLPDNVIRRKIRKDLRSIHKQQNHLRPRQKIKSEVGDAETIRKMIADLPAKRHRVVVNPMNPTLRPRRKLDKQRSKIMIKHRSTDDSKSRKLRSINDLNNSVKSVNMPPNNEEENNIIPNQDDEDNKPLKPTRRPTDSKNTRHSDTIKRKSVLNRAKRKIQIKNTSIAKLPDLDTVDASSNSPDEELSKNNAPKKIDVNKSQYSSRQLAGRGGNYNRGNKNRGSTHRGNYDRGNSNRGNYNRGNSNRGNSNRGNSNRGNYDRGNNNRENCNRGNDSHESNREHGQGAGENNGDDEDKMGKDPSAENDPRHSKAASTVDCKTKDKSNLSQSTDQQECKISTQHLTTLQTEIFENEAADSRLDKPPLPCNQKVPIDPQKNKSNKTRKGKGLNDCIAMLKNKLPSANIDTNETEAADAIDNPAATPVVEPAAQERAASKPAATFHSAANKAAQEAAFASGHVNPLPSVCQNVQQDARQVTQPDAQTDDRQSAEPDAPPVPQPTGQTEAGPAEQTYVLPAVETDARLVIQVHNPPVHSDDSAAVRTEDRSAAHTRDHPAVQNDDCPAVHNDAIPAVHLKPQPAVLTKDHPAVQIDGSSAGPKDTSPDVSKDDRPAVHIDNRQAVQIDTRTASYKTAQTEAAPALEADIPRAVQPDARPALEADIPRDVQPDARPAPHLTVQSESRPEAQLFSHQIANLAANTAQYSAEDLVIKPASLVSQHLALHSAEHLAFNPVEHLALHSAAHLAAHQAAHQTAHPTVYSGIRPHYNLQLATLAAHQAQIAAQYRNPIDPNPRFFMPGTFDFKIGSNPTELFSRSLLLNDGELAYQPNNLALDQVTHSLPLCSENQTTPTTESGVNYRGQQKKSPVTTIQPKKTPAKRKSTRLTARSDVQPNLPQNVFGLSPHEIVPQPPLGGGPHSVIQFHDQYSNMMISPDSDKNKKRKQTNIPTDAHHINKPEPKRAEYLNPYNMSGGQLIENKTYQQPIDNEPNTRSAVEHRILGDPRNIVERISEMRTNSEQRTEKNLFKDQRSATITKPSEYRPHTEHRLPNTLIQAEQSFRVPTSFADPTFSDLRNYPEQRSFAENRPLHEQRPFPGMRSHVDQNIYPEPRPHTDSRPYTEKMPFPEQMSFPELRPLPDRSLEQMAYEQRYSRQMLLSGRCPEQTICQKLGTYPDQRQHSQQTSYPEPVIYPDNRTIAEKIVDQHLMNEQMLPPEQRSLSKRRSSKEKKSVSERRVSNEHWPSYEHRSSNDILSIQDKNIFKEQNVTNELRLPAEQKQLSVDQPSVELRPIVEQQPSVVRRPSDEHRPSIEPTPAYEETPKEKNSSERRLSNELSRANKHAMVNKAVFNENTPLTKQGRFELWQAINQQLLLKQRLEKEQIQLLEQSIEEGRLLNERISLHESRLSESRSSTEEKPVDELTIQNKSLLEKDILIAQQTYSELNRHSQPYIAKHMPANMYHESTSKPPHSDHDLFHKVQDKAYILNNYMAQFLLEGPLNLSGRPIPQQRPRVLPPHDSSSLRNYQMYKTVEFSDLNSGRERFDMDNVIVDMRVKSSNQSVVQMSESIHEMSEPILQVSEPIPPRSQPIPQMPETLSQRSEPIPQRSEPIPQMPEPIPERSESIPQRSEPIPQMSEPFIQNSETLPQMPVPMKHFEDDFPSNIIAEREPKQFSGIMNDASDLPTDLSSKSKDIHSGDITVDDESLLDIMSTEDTKDQQDGSLDVNTELLHSVKELPSGETKINNNNENIIQQLNSNVSAASIMAATNPIGEADTVVQTMKTTISTNSDESAALTTLSKINLSTSVTMSNVPTTLFIDTSLSNQTTTERLPNAFAKSSLNSVNDVILPMCTLSNPVTAKTVNKHESNEPVYTLAEATISVTKVEANISLSTASTTNANTLAGTTTGAPLDYGGAPNSGSQIGPAMRNSHMQTVASGDATDIHSKIDPVTKAVNKVDASTATNETPDPETTRNIAMYPHTLADVLEVLPCQQANWLLNAYPQYVSTSTSTPRKRCESNVSNASHQTSTSENMLVQENQDMSGMHAFIPNYHLPTNIQNYSPHFMASFNMDKNHPMTFIPPQFSMLPPPPPPPPPPVQDTSPHHPPTQPTFVPPLPPNPPPPLFLPLPALIKTDDSEEDIKPPVMALKVKVENDLESENPSVDKFQSEPSAAIENNTESENTYKENIVIDLTEEENQAVNKEVVKLPDDLTKPGAVPPQQINNYFSVVTTPNLKTVSDKTASLRAVRIKTPSERNKSSTIHLSEKMPNTEQEVPFTARPVVNKEVPECTKARNDCEIEESRELSEQYEKQPIANTSMETRLTYQDQDFEGEDNKLLQLRISLAIQQTEISSTQRNNKNKAIPSKLPATISPLDSIRPENFTNYELQKPVAPTEEIVVKKNMDLTDNSILNLRTVMSPVSEQVTHVLDRSHKSASSQNYGSIDGAHLPSKDNVEPKTYDTTSLRATNPAVVERLTSDTHMTLTDDQLFVKVKHYNTLEEDDSDDDVSLAIIVKNRDQQKNNVQDNLPQNKSANNNSPDEKIKEDILLKETTNNLNNDRTTEGAYINDNIETKQKMLFTENTKKELLHHSKACSGESSITEGEEYESTDINNRQKSNGGSNDQKLQEASQNLQFETEADIQIERNIITAATIIDKETRISSEQQIEKPQAVNEKPDQQTNSSKKVGEEEIKHSFLVSQKPNDKDMLLTPKDKLKKKSKYNLSTSSLNNDDPIRTKIDIGNRNIFPKIDYQKSKEDLAETNIKESQDSQNANIANIDTKECSTEDVTDNLNPIADKNIKKVVATENNKNSVETDLSNDLERCSEKDENITTPLRRSRRRKSALTKDEIVDEPAVLTEHKTPLTKKQLIFSKLLLDEENNTGPQAHSTPVKDVCPVKENIQSNHNNSMTDPTSPISYVDIEETPIGDRKKRKRTKQKKSVQLRREIGKKKKSNETNDKIEAGHSQRLKKDSKIRLDSENSEGSDLIRHSSHTITKIEEKNSESANKDLATNTDNLNLLSGSIAKDEKLIVSGEKRKLDDTATDTCSQITKPKKLKFMNKSNEDLEEKQDIHILKEKLPLSLEKRTACYMPVAARRTRSKSVIVKSSTADFYDPYDIDLDDMIEKPDSFRCKINVSDKNSQKAKNHNHFKSKRNIKPEISRKNHALVKKTLKPSSYHVTYSNKIAAGSKDNVIDSDDSTKSDVPLTKYIENKEKKILQSDKPNKRNLKDTVLARNENQKGKGKTGNKDLTKNRRTLATVNDIDKSSSRNDAEELRSEKFMESFGFFSQRKPRKSNLLASKKIAETFHIIANESDDAYFSPKKRTRKRSHQNENKKSVGGRPATTGPRRRITNKRIIKRIPKPKKKVFVPVPRICRLCKKEFRRSDNFLRHQMTVLHASKISEIELRLKTIPVIEKPNYLIAYKRQLDRLKLLTKKYASRKNSKYKKIKLPSLDKILAKVNKKVREQQLAQRRGLSRDEALFIDCCQLLKSNKNDVKTSVITGFNTVDNNFSESTVKEFDLLDKPIKGDGDVDSITAKNILESDEVKNLEKDLISGLKEAANEGSLKSKIIYQRSVSQVGLHQTDDEQIGYSSSKEPEPTYEPAEPYPISNPTKTKKQPEVKEKMYPDIIESIDMFEDKFDKIKRKCRSQAAAAAAKQTQAAIEPSASFKCRKKSKKKKARRNSKINHQSSQVPTKGALKGFDGIKVSIPTSDINMSAIVPSITTPKKKKKGNSRKKKAKISESCSKNDSQRNGVDGMTSHKEVDVYEFLDNEDAVFELRPSTLMERFKSSSCKEAPGTSKINPGVDEVDNSRDSVSDGDDFVYMSDDYVCSDNETENSLLSCELSNGKVKNSSPLKRKDALEKNVVMGKIFRFNAVRSDRKSVKVKETAKPKANLDQLFDSLLEEEQSSSMLNKDAVSPKNDDFVTPKKHDHASKYEKYNRTLSSRDEGSSPTKLKSPSPKQLIIASPKEYDSASFIDYGPSTSKAAAIDFGPSTSKKHDVISPKDFNDLSPSKYASPLIKKHVAHEKITTVKHTKSDVVPIKKRDSKKEKSPSNKLDEGISTSYDYNADAYDQYDDTGVARQRARRKCTVGKQNVLAETWSSESEPDGIPPRPNSAESVVLSNARRKKGKKRDGHHTGARRGNNRHISFKKQDVESRLTSYRNTARGSGAGTSRGRRDSDDVGSVNPYDAPAPSTSTAHLLLGTAGSKPPRPRTTAYYNWSSEGEEEPEHMQQHGWIVGDSHKKLVTMLAHAKGRKRDNDDKSNFVE